MTQREQTIWAAGFFDGEGCVSIARGLDKRGGKNYRRYQMSIIVVQRDKRPLDLFVELFGGGLRKTYRRNYDAVYWEWKLNGKEARFALIGFLPYLQVKREAASLAISFQEFWQLSQKQVGVRRPEIDLDTAELFCNRAAMLNERASHKDWTEDACKITEKETQVN